MHQPLIQRPHEQFLHISRSPIPSNQLRALTVLARIKNKDPVYTDALCCNNEKIRELIRDIRNRALFIDQARMHCDRARTKVWEYFYIDKFNGNDFDALLTHSRMALFCVDDNEINTAAKALFNLRAATTPSHEIACTFELRVQVLSRFLL